MNIFINPDENRFRAGWRIAAQLFLMYLIGLLLVLFTNSFIPIKIDLLGTICIAFGAIASTVLAAKGLDNRPWQQFGVVFDKKHMREWAYGFVLAAIAMGIIFAIEYAVGWLTVTRFGWQQINASHYVLTFGGYFLFMVLVGFWEELVFRGYQIINASEGLNLPDIPRKQAVLLAVLISSVAFGIGHAFNPNAGWISTLNIILAGVMLAFPFIVTGRLSLSIGLHIGWNFFQGGVFGFPVSGMPGRASLLQINQQGPDWLTGGAFGPEAGMIGLLAMGVIIGMLIGYFKKIRQKLTIYHSLGIYSAHSNDAPDK